MRRLRKFAPSGPTVGRVLGRLARTWVAVTPVILALSVSCSGSGQRAPAARLAIAPASEVALGDVVMLSACGFPGSDSLRVSIDSRPLAQIRADPGGAVTTLTTMNTALNPGVHTLTADGSTGVHAETTFTARGGSATPGLRASGADLTPVTCGSP